MACSYIRTKVSDDIIGAEYAGTLKNIYAIAVGIAHGLGYGDNFQSVLMSNSIRELKRFLKQIHKTKARYVTLCLFGGFARDWIFTL